MDKQTQSMFFKSAEVEAHWDTWMYFHDGTFYLYYLITEYSPGEGFGLATSPDGVTWTDHGWVVRASDKMVTYLGTGAVWKSSDFDRSGRFICNYSEWRTDEGGKETQNILFAWSEDLIHWTKFGDDYMFKVDTRWYERYGRWDCIYPLPRPEAGYFGYWTATPKDHVGIGFGQSRDGWHWEALPAPVLIWDDAEVPKDMEAGAIEKLGNKYYAMTGLPGLVIRTMIADQQSGPFKVATTNYGLMENSGAHRHTYFARFLRTPDAMLVNHQAITRFKNTRGRAICYFAPLKEAFVDAEGTLWLTYWQGNEQLKRNPVTLRFAEAEPGLVRMSDMSLDTAGGVVIEGKIALPADEEPSEAWPGLYIDYDEGRRSVIMVGAGGVTHFGVTTTSQSEIELEDEMAREWPFGQIVHFRLLLKESVLEFYLDDIYIQSYSLPAPATGQIGIYGPVEAITDVAAWTVKG